MLNMGRRWVVGGPRNL